MRKLSYLFITCIVMMCVVSFVACSSDDDGEEEMVRSSQFDYSLTFNDDVISIADVSVCYIGTDGVEKEEALTEPSWKKSLTANKFDVSSGISINMHLKSDVKLDKESYTLSYTVACSVMSMQNGGMVDAKIGSSNISQTVPKDKIDELLESKSGSMCYQVDGSGQIASTTLSWQNNGPGDDLQVDMGKYDKIVYLSKIKSGTYKIEAGASVMVFGDSEPYEINFEIGDNANVAFANAVLNPQNVAIVKCDGSAKIYFIGENYFGHKDSYGDSQSYDCGIQAGSGTLTLAGSGRLTIDLFASGDGAAIGSNYEESCGNITLNSGEYDLSSGFDAAGIGGGGGRCHCGVITINGCNIIAHGSFAAAGIGSSEDGDCGGIVINNSVIWTEGGSKGAGIGCGSGGYCGYITINSSVITACSDGEPSGIGCGWQYSTCGDITITDCKITTSGGYDEGIGLASESSVGKTTIYDSVINGFRIPYSFKPAHED